MFSASQPETKYGSEAEESGYLTYVSPQKKKISDDSITYFTFKLEQEDKVRVGVCFEPEMREEFKIREGQPIKIDCKRQLFDDRLMVSKKQCIEEAALSYPLVRSKMQKFESILEIKRDWTDREVSTILTLIKCKREAKNLPTKYGPRNLKVYEVNDWTDRIDLDVWGDDLDDILEIGRTYSAKTLRAYIYNNQQRLSNVSDTEIQPILYSAENNLNKNCNNNENNTGTDHCKENPTSVRKTLNFQDFPLNVPLIKSEPNLDSGVGMQQNSHTLHVPSTNSSELKNDKPNNNEMESEIKIEYTEEREAENLGTAYTPENHFNYTGNIYSIIIDKYYLCGKCRGRNDIPSNAEHFKCKKCKIMFKIAHFKKKLRSYCSLSQNERIFKFDHEIIAKLEEKFPLSLDLETSLIEYKNDVTLKCVMFNNEYFVTDITFHGN